MGWVLRGGVWLLTLGSGCVLRLLVLLLLLGRVVALGRRVVCRSWRGLGVVVESVLRLWVWERRCAFVFGRAWWTGMVCGLSVGGRVVRV